MENNESLKIVKLESKNIMRLDAVEITPDGNTVVIGGKNAQGKTSTIESIVLALGGRKTFAKQPLKEGAESGEIICDLGDIIVSRKFTQKNQTSGGVLIVANKDGARYPSPQALLDGFVGKLTFDPLAFANEDSKKQLETLKDALGVSFEELDEKRTEFYQKRTDFNRELKTFKAKLSSASVFPDIKDKEVLNINSLIQQLKTERGKSEEKADLEKRIIDTSETITELENRIELTQRTLNLEIKDLKKLKAQLEPLADGKPEEIEKQISEADETNVKIKANIEYNDLEKQIESSQNDADRLTTEIKEIDSQKAEKIAKAKLPIKGLSFDEEDVLYNGIPFSQSSSAEQLKISVAMGLAMNPKLKILLIRNGSLLDKDNMKMIAEMAKKADAQVWIEKVTSDPSKCQVIIEDGKVKA